MVLLKKNVFRKKGRAQSSLETLLILATALFILTALVSMVYDQLDSGNLQQQQKMGSNVLRTLAKEIDDTYFLGPGTVKNITITIPGMVDYNKSYIEGKGLVLNVGGSDFVASTKIEARGIWPNTSGSYVFQITAYDDYVGVSTQVVSFNPSQVNEVIPQFSSTDVNVSITSSSNSDLNYLINIEFPSSGENLVTLTSSLSSILVPANASAIVPLTLNCERDSFGSYNGKIVFVPVNSTDFNVSVPIDLVCSSSQTKLGIYPIYKLINSVKLISSTDSLLVCNGSSGDFSNSVVSFTGEAARYIFSDFNGTITAESCRSLDLIINPVPDANNFSGKIYVYSSGYSAVADLNLVVSVS